MIGVAVSFFLGDERYAFRRWSVVPRNGDEVMLSARTGVQKVPFKVTRVVFGIEPRDARPEEQEVNVEIERIKERRAKERR